jgi:hypothetical protein
MAKSIVGDLIGKRGIVYAPINRPGVLLLFSRLLDEFDMLVEETAVDCSFVVVRRRVDTGWERITIYLAFKSSDFNDGVANDDDFLICWHHDRPECPLKVFELKTLFDGKADERKSEEVAEANPVEVPSGEPLANILPENSSELLINRAVTRDRFEKAIGDLDEKIKNIFPG